MMSGMLLRVIIPANDCNTSIYYVNNISLIWLAGFHKMVETTAKQKGCEIIGNWQRSIINHLYWCVSSTPDDDTETITSQVVVP